MGMTPENFGWLLGVVAMLGWIATVYNAKKQPLTMDALYTEEATKQVAILQRQVTTLQEMWAEAQITIKQLQHDLDYQTRKSVELEARVLALAQQLQRAQEREERLLKS